MKKPLIIILVLLVVIGIAAGIFYYLKKKKEADADDSSGTSVNVSINTKKLPDAKGPAISAGFQKWMKYTKASGALEGESKSVSTRKPFVKTT
jgi:flagellar basal body-associated protein FliL